MSAGFGLSYTQKLLAGVFSHNLHKNTMNNNTADLFKASFQEIKHGAVWRSRGRWRQKIFCLLHSRVWYFSPALEPHRALHPNQLGLVNPSTVLSQNWAPVLSTAKTSPLHCLLTLVTVLPCNNHQCHTILMDGIHFLKSKRIPGGLRAWQCSENHTDSVTALPYSATALPWHSVTVLTQHSVTALPAV